MVKQMEERHSVWIRIFHWINMIAITMLILTGFYIHAPQSFRLFDTMTTARTVHFCMAYLLCFGVVGRMYYMIVANDTKNLIYEPVNDTKKLPSMIKYYMFLADDHPFYGKYNPGQKAMYTGVFAMALVMIITGFILYKPLTFGFMAGWLGGFIVVRIIHYAITWIFVLCILAHVYLDVAEGIPILKSMFTGKIPTDFHHGYHEKEM